MVQEAADHPITINKQGRAVAVIMSLDRLETIAETMEILARPGFEGGPDRGQIASHELALGFHQQQDTKGNDLPVRCSPGCGELCAFQPMQKFLVRHCARQHEPTRQG